MELDHYDQIFKLELMDANVSVQKVSDMFDQLPEEVLHLCGAFCAIALDKGESVTELFGNATIFKEQCWTGMAHQDEVVSELFSALDVMRRFLYG